MGFIASFTGYLTPIFLVLSPILSYSDQAYSMHRNKSSAGFSLDIPLIMLVASLCRIFYYPGARFDIALLAQSVVMVVIQVILLKIALDHRPAPASKGGDGAVPFARVNDGFWERARPYGFWQWRSPKPYWQFILSLFIGLTVCELILGPMRGIYPTYSAFIGYAGLSIEATLPLPQIMANAKLRSCKGFRVSVLASWLAGDAMKMAWFFTASTQIPLAFKICGIFQAACDAFLGVQYLMYGNGQPEVIKEHALADWQGNPGPYSDTVTSGRETITGRRTSSVERKM
ncbi:hypothetical protein QBC47DRAFT_368877 [Echria macrotheca]|uniref:PQ loop repeat protein n=1 Tax=Echria macrotheca TaxID=438768 RepID=A0AAJ0BS67_9PEZI|nr:hypothetical protein QBC47DRAFT_368877 [Echria macrotheca]